MTDIEQPAFSVTVDGKRFVLVPFDGLTLEQDAWITAKLERAGLTDPGIDKLPPQDREAEMIRRLFESGSALSGLLAGFLVEEGQPWSQERALVHAKRLGAANGFAERARLLGVVRGVVAGFFLGTAGSGDHTPLHSESLVVPDLESPETASAVSTSAGGIPSSARSGDMTPTPSDEESSGPSATRLAPTSSI